MTRLFLYTIAAFFIAFSSYAQKQMENENIKEILTDSYQQCGGQNPEIRGTPGDDVLFGTENADVIHGYGGNDVIMARGGDDIVCGGTGNDQIDLGHGSDIAYGMSGNDTIYGDGGRDTIDGGLNNDTIYGGCPGTITFVRGETCDLEADAGDTISGGDGADTIHGNLARDEIDGGPGNDSIFGNQHNDVIKCGDGNDNANGGPGNEDWFAPPYNDCEQHVSVERPQLRFSVEDTPLYPNSGIYTRNSVRDYLIVGKVPCKKNQSLSECEKFKKGFVQTPFVSCADYYTDGVVDSINISKSKNRLKRWEFIEFRCSEMLPDGTKGASTNVRLFDYSKPGNRKRATIPNPNLMIGMLDVNSSFNAYGTVKEIKLLHQPTATVFNDGVNQSTSTYSLTPSIPDTTDVVTMFTQVNRCPPGMAITGFSVGHIPEKGKRTKPYFIMAECRKIEQRWDTYN